MVGRRKYTVNTSQVGAIPDRVPLTPEHGCHGLAKESLTFFPDLKCCPPSAAGGGGAVQVVGRGVVGAALPGFGLQSELVGRGDGREGGA